ncbi:DEAD/DEAH box helicase [Aeromonas dhakensis]|uniref:DEAD/DEAH box helicase n=1 Tax=Aeromonas dhakensis TaxID=196024 RepID=UPI003989E393
MIDNFDALHKINDLINAGDIDEARNQVIKFLAELKRTNGEFPAPLNHFIRSVGLYPYLQLEHASWQEKFIYESFKVDIGGSSATLHREQSLLLKKLINGNSIAVSAPTSFGKSFVVDSFIAIRKPKNVVVIVPTIALTDETRRRMHRKFSREYKIITTTDVQLADRNIFIFPQERVFSYINTIENIDILIIDEFYKASKKHDKERSPSLLRAIINLSKIAKQRYFLAPNIKHLRDNIFTDGMDFISLDFNTVFLEKHELYKDIKDCKFSKSDALLKIISESSGKTLIYAGTYSSIGEVSNLIIDSIDNSCSKLLSDFSSWLTKNYSRNWSLTSLVKRGCGVHNGQLHRSLSQIQVKLFEEDNGLDMLLSTSSIIEGVNTSAENVVLWKNKNGQPKLTDFTYKNIIGRGGRMFRHFIGNIYLLEEPPKEQENILELEYSNELAASLDDSISQKLTPEQIAKIIEYREEMADILGEESFQRIQSNNVFTDSDTSVVLSVTRALSDSPQNFNGLGYLNSKNPEQWDWSLYKVLEIIPGYIGAPYKKFVEFIKVIANNWSFDFHKLLDELSDHDISIDEFFDYERKASFKLSSLLNEVNIIYQELYPKHGVDISSFVANVSHAFLPPNVYILEEYGLPRMISKKIHYSGIVDLEDINTPIHDVLDKLNSIGLENISSKTQNLDSFDLYILRHFFDGISHPK